MGVSNVGRFSIADETIVAVDPGAESWVDMRICEPPDIDTDKSRHRDTTVQSRMHAFAGFRDGIKSGTIKVPQYGEGLPAALNQAAAYSAPQTGLEKMLTKLMGGVSGNSGTKISGAASTTTSLNVTDGEGVRIVKGGAVVTRHSSLDPYEMREIKNVATGAAPDVLTLKHALKTAPITDLTDVFNCVTYNYRDAAVGGDGNTFATRYLGLDPEDQWILRGTCGTFGIQLKLDDYVKFTWDLQAADWDEPTSGMSLVGTTYTGAGGLVWKTAQMQWQTVGVTTRSLMVPMEVEINPGMSLVRVTGPTPDVGGPGKNGTHRFRMLRARPTIKFSGYLYENHPDYYTDFADEDKERMVMFSIGASPVIAGVGDGMMGFSLPRCRYLKAPKIQRKGDGLVMIEVEMEGLEDTDITSPTTDTSAAADRENACLRIHQG